MTRSYAAHWSDMSNYIVHFTKRTEDQSDYDSMMGILSTGSLIPRSRFGCARSGAVDPESQQAVCFSEIPLHLLGRLVQRRKTKLGIGFSKEFAVTKGAQPIWYVPNESRTHDAIIELMHRGASDAGDPIWRLTPFIDLPGSHKTGSYEFQWEREWRVVGRLSFEPEEVAFLFIPEDLHDAARDFFLEAQSEGTGPGYFCPYLDPTWSAEEITQALSRPAG